ncbi:MAG: hypothetical protein ABR583_14710 [Gaiellaceae bacterium]
MALLDSIKKLLGMDRSSSDAVDQVPPTRSERTEDAPPPGGISSDLPLQPDTEPYEPKP